MWLLFIRSHSNSVRTSARSDRRAEPMGQIGALAPKLVCVERSTSNTPPPQKEHIQAQSAGHSKPERDNMTSSSLTAVIRALSSPLVPHPERDLTIDLHSGSTLIAIKDESNHRIRFRRLQEIYIMTTRSDQGIGFSSRNPSKKDIATDLYSGSALATHYDEMSPFDFSGLFRSLNT
jgi:hypothetical protein